MTEMRIGLGAKLSKNASCCAVKVICQSASTTWRLLFLFLTKQECLSARQSTTISAHLQTQRANTSFIGKSRATCRKKNNNCWSDNSVHDLGRDIENASIPRKYGSIEWGEKTTIYPFLKLSKNFILRARATDIFSSGISPSKTNMVFTLLCSTLTDCSAFNIALYFTHW